MATASTVKTVKIQNVWDHQDFSKPRNRVLLAEDREDILLALNCYSPGDQNELHFHVGSGQSFLVLKGPITLRHRHKDADEKDTAEVELREGDCILIPNDVYYQMHNTGTQQALLYQVKQAAAEEISIIGKGILKASDYFTQEWKDKEKVGGDSIK